MSQTIMIKFKVKTKNKIMFLIISLKTSIIIQIKYKDNLNNNKLKEILKWILNNLKIKIN